MREGRKEGRTNGNPLDFGSTTLDSPFWSCSRNLTGCISVFFTCNISRLILEGLGSSGLCSTSKRGDSVNVCLCVQGEVVAVWEMAR